MPELLDTPSLTGVQRRTYPFQMRAVDTKAGDTARVAGYASVWGSLNSFDEVFVPGAFAEDLGNTDSSKPLVLGYMHRDAIGKWDVHREDEHGLYLEGTISPTTLGKEASILVRDGVLTGLSVGFIPEVFQFAEPGERCVFDTPQGQVVYQFDSCVLYVLKACVVEASLVIAPSDDEARLVAVRDIMGKAARALPALRSEPSWDDVAYSMALLMGGRGAGAFSDLPDTQHRALYQRVADAYPADKTPPAYERTPDYKLVEFRHDERHIFHDRYLRKTIDSLTSGLKGHDGPLSVETRQAALAAETQLRALLEPQHADPDLTEVLGDIQQLTRTLKGD